MPAPDFVDTNVLVYAYDASDPRKQAIARDILRKAVAGGVVASSQVLAEFASTLLHKLSPPVGCEDLIALLDTLSPIKLVFARWRFGAPGSGSPGRIWTPLL